MKGREKLIPDISTNKRLDSWSEVISLNILLAAKKESLSGMLFLAPSSSSNFESNFLAFLLK